MRFIFCNNKINFINGYNSDNEELYSKKNNNLIAMGLSAIIPGTGQFYKKQWIRGGVYLGLELLLLNYRNSYNSKGDEYVSRYKEFADEHWSFENWIKNYYLFIDVQDPVYQTMINESSCNLSENNYSNSNGHEGYCAPWYEAHYIEYYNTDTNELSNTRNSFILNELFEE